MSVFVQGTLRLDEKLLPSFLCSDVTYTNIHPTLPQVLEISGQDYVEKVNKAGPGIWVFLHLYKQGVPLCALINQHLPRLAAKYPKVGMLVRLLLCLNNALLIICRLILLLLHLIFFLIFVLIFSG